jgi:hypothetical protein
LAAIGMAGPPSTICGLKGARPLGQAAEEPALLQRRDQAMDPGLGRQVQRFLHLIEGGRDAAFLDPFMDEHEQFVLLTGEHRCGTSSKAP